jgi:GxxExxY protein
MKNDNVYWQECYNIVGACFEVHRVLGCGFLEGVYQEALAIEFKNREIPFEAEKELEIDFKGVTLNKKFKPDFVCYGKIIVEVKACNRLVDDHISQTLNYLNITRFKVGILVNFGEKSLKYKRLVL